MDFLKTFTLYSNDVTEVLIFFSLDASIMTKPFA
jgi:hypothetical protein